MNQHPLISVLMSVYNAERYIAEAVESILSQTLVDFEFIIADDGSTDGSISVLELYADRDLRISLITQKNMGLTRTLNKILGTAKGDFIARMDADDIALPTRFEDQVNFLRANPHIVCVGGAFELIDESGRLLTRIVPPTKDDTIQQKALAGHGSICHPTAMIRRDALIRIGGYDETLQTAQDLDLWLRLGEEGALANLEEVVLKFRLHSHSISELKRVQQRQAARLACERAWKRRGIEGNFEATEPWRPGEDRVSKHHFMLKYGWWAFNSSQRQTAMIYGMKAIFALPLAMDGWKLLACALFKKLPDRKL